MLSRSRDRLFRLSQQNCRCKSIIQCWRSASSSMPPTTSVASRNGRRNRNRCGWRGWHRLRSLATASRAPAHNSRPTVGLKGGGRIPHGPAWAASDRSPRGGRTKVPSRLRWRRSNRQIRCTANDEITAPPQNPANRDSRAAPGRIHWSARIRQQVGEIFDGGAAGEEIRLNGDVPYHLLAILKITQINQPFSVSRGMFPGTDCGRRDCSLDACMVHFRNEFLAATNADMRPASSDPIAPNSNLSV